MSFEDPNTWELPVAGEPERLYLGKETYCLVDAEDRDWALKWRWSFVLDKTRKKKYASRSTRLQGRAGPQIRLLLHKEILRRIGPPPSPSHTIGDHINGDSLDNRRSNLRWATPSENRKNQRSKNQ